MLGSGTTGNFVQGNNVGTDVNGALAVANGGDGISLTFGASTNTIGGTDPGDRNVLSGNLGAGVTISGSGTASNLVQGNYIGTDTTGTLSLGVLGNASAASISPPAWPTRSAGRATRRI